MRATPTKFTLLFALLAVLAGTLPAPSVDAQSASSDSKPKSGPSSRPKTPPPADTSMPEIKGKLYAEMKTSLGSLYIELDADRAPITVENFLQYALDDHYDGTVFHRVVPTFCAQAGGFTADGVKSRKPKPTRAPIKNESDNGLRNAFGTMAMARTAARDSATSQFFFNLKENRALDHDGPAGGYAVFGRLVHGFDVLRKIEAAPKQAGLDGQPVLPVTAIVIEDVKLVDKSVVDEAKKS